MTAPTASPGAAPSTTTGDGLDHLACCEDGNLGVCGTDLSDVPAGALPLEQAFTCDGCQSVHWFTLAAAPDGAS